MSYYSEIREERERQEKEIHEWIENDTFDFSYNTKEVLKENASKLLDESVDGKEVKEVLSDIIYAIVGEFQ